jgi:hypothetical protein
MRCLKNLDALNSGGWGVFIAPTTKTAVGEGCCRWAHRTVRCASHVTQPLGFWQFRPLELSHLGAPNSPVRLLALLWLYANCPRTIHVVSRPLKSTVALATVAPLGTLDSPVNYSGAALQKPESKECSLYGPWGTGHYPVAHRKVRCARLGFSLVSFAPFFWTLTWIFLLVCVEPLAPVECII